MTDDQPARRELGRRLAAARKAGGYTQQELAAVTRYSRGTVSAAEVGGPEVGRAFWMRCDLVLGTGDAFALAFDEVRARERGRASGLPADVAGAGPGDPGRARHLLACAGTAEALAGYRDLGWPASGRNGRLELTTGEVVDALELPLGPGLLAATLWLHSRGRPDEAGGLPPLPDPAQSLAVITAGKRCFFLAASGCCPWAGDAPARAGDPGRAPGEERGGPVIRWHADGGRILVPPSRLPGGGRAAWACLPALPMVPVPPAALLTLLATAAASASRHDAALTLPGGVRLVPASRLESSAP
ncbi:MAG TPA: helix-turn-helix domain-containing protein [Streptosporangiaceae bacterium]|nr:helix-turn-helix domain-containing protein [Streptosporangiaceae bacterium]